MNKHELYHELHNTTICRKQRLNKCNAFVGTTKYNSVTGSAYELLFSYDSLVAAYSYTTKSVIVFNKCSNTTVQHVNKFIKFLGNKVTDIFYAYVRKDRVQHKCILSRQYYHCIEEKYKKISCDLLSSDDYRYFVNQFIGVTNNEVL